MTGPSPEQLRQKKIAILGAGGNGSIVGADLIRTGHDVVLLDQWPAHIEAIRNNGLHIEMMGGTDLRVAADAHHLCDLASLNRTFDIVLLAVKAYDTRWSAELIKPYLAADGLLVGLQNAMTAGTIADIVGADRTVGCVVELASEFPAAGHVLRKANHDKAWFGVGALDPSMENRADEIEALLKNVGQVSRTPRILAAKYMKLVINAMSLGTFAMMGVPWSEASALPGMRELVIQIGEEAVAAGRDMGYGIEPIFGLTAADLANTNRPLERVFEALDVHARGWGGKNTVRQDFEKGRRTEVDLINGLVVETSNRNGRAAPANAAIVEIARRIQTGELKPGPDNMTLLQQLVRPRDEADAGPSPRPAN